MYKQKYAKYKTKYLDLCKNQTGGCKTSINIVILHHPHIFGKISEDLENIIQKIFNFGKVYNYWFKFTKNVFELDDLLFENVAKDINRTFSFLNNFLIIALEHACPFGLYYSYHYSSKCDQIICYPYRYYSQGSYERRLWKLKENSGYANIIKNHNYNVDDYMININNERLQTLINDDSDDGKQALWYVIDFNLQKQRDKIPTVFEIPTILYVNLDLDLQSVINENYNRTDIASMKKIFSENDAMQQSMMMNFEKVKYHAMLKDLNSTKKILKIKYLIAGWEDNEDILNEVILFCNK